jgi:hypothetical protein
MYFSLLNILIGYTQEKKENYLSWKKGYLLKSDRLTEHSYFPTKTLVQIEGSAIC